MKEKTQNPACENACQEKFKTLIGGQALIEGIYMRGPQKEAIVVRSPDGLVKTVKELRFVKDRYPVLGWPMIRGVVNLVASLVSGVKALMYSAEFFPEEEDTQPSKFDLWLEKKFGEEKAMQAVIYFAVVLGICFAVGLFLFLPTFLVGLIRPLHDHLMLRNLCEGIAKVLIFIVYLGLISRMNDMKRVFSYHGAEHKCIRCYEAKLPLTVENVRPMTRLHPRCGTSFLFVVIIISILVNSVILVSNTALRILLHFCMLPVVVAISYECNRLVGKYDNALTRILSAPGMWFQHLTTNEPDDSMIEVGIAAIELVLPEKEGDDEW